MNKKVKEITRQIAIIDQECQQDIIDGDRQFVNHHYMRLEQLQNQREQLERERWRVWSQMVSIWQNGDGPIVKYPYDTSGNSNQYQLVMHVPMALYYKNSSLSRRKYALHLNSIIEFFKRSPSVKLPPNPIIKDRIGLLRKLDELGMGEWLSVSRDELICNLAFLPRYVAWFLTTCSPEELGNITFMSESHQTTFPFDAVDPVHMLLNTSSQPPRLRDFRIYDDLLATYDFSKFGSGSVFFNTLESTGLTVSRAGSLTVYCGGSSPSRNDLLRLASVVVPHIVDLEGYRLSALQGLQYKSDILGKYCGYFIPDCGDSTQYIIEDAYSDLLRLSNLGQNSLSMSERVVNLQFLRERFYQNLKHASEVGYYSPIFTNFESEVYDNMFQTLFQGLNNFVPILLGTKKNDNAYVRDYYIFDQKMRETNKLKINPGSLNKYIINFYKYNDIARIINDIHLDVRIGLFNLAVHNNLINSNLYYKNSPMVKFISLLCKPYYRHKPILIKILIKKILDPLYLNFKSDGLLSFIGLECVFGYRNSHLIKQEVKDDYLSWFEKDMAQYDDIQYKFIRKWANPFFMQLNYRGERILDKIKANLSHFGTFEEILGAKELYMTSKGSVDDFHVVTEKGKKRNISKSMYFNLIEDQSQRERVFKDTVRRNKVIIKREEFVKQRIVINSTLNTFVPLSKLNKYVTQVTKGSGITYFSNTRAQKAEHFQRLQNYLLFNKYHRNKYLCMPLDYSSYDHTITMGFIKATLESLGEITGHKKQIQTLVSDFEEVLKKERVYFEELGEDDPDNNKEYKYGMLSGWKITSSVESLGNAIVSYGVSQELGKELVDYETMGDDLILIFNSPDLTRDAQLKFLQDVCAEYESLGFEMNPSKNSVGYYFLEFLRVGFLPGFVQNYPLRIIGSMIVNKPGRSESTFGFEEFQSVVNKVIKRYGIFSQREKIINFYKNMYIRPDIRKFGLLAFQNPYAFKVARKEKIDFRVVGITTRDTPIFKRYKNILSEIIGRYPIEGVRLENYVWDNFVSRKIAVTDLVPLPNYKKKVRLAKWQWDTLRYVFRYIIKDKGRVMDLLYLPDYHLSKILMEYIKAYGFQVGRAILEVVMTRLKQLGYFTQETFLMNLKIIRSAISKNELLALLDVDRLRAAEGFAPVSLVSRAKEILLRNILSVNGLTHQQQDFIQNFFRKDNDPLVKKVLSQILDEMTVTINVSSGMPIGFRAD